MSEMNNPYAAPESDVAEAFTASPLASRLRRLGAAIIDSILVSIAGGLLASLFPGVDFDSMSVFFSVGYFGAIFGSFIAYIAINVYFLNESGQTIGKKLLSIRIATLDGSKPDLIKLLFVRYLSKVLLGVIPLIGLVNVLLIFRSDKRCGHDLIATTQVVKA